MTALHAATVGTSQAVLTPLGLNAFRAGVLSLVLPFFDLPLVAVSISAPLFLLVFMEVSGSGALSRPRYFFLLSLAALFATTQIAAVSIRILAGDAQSVAPATALLLSRYCYWAFLFAATAIVVDRQRLGENIVALAAWGLIALAVIRLVEATAFGRWGAGNPRWLSQNDYGFAFSMFTPFVIWLVVRSRGATRVFAGCGAFVVVTAVVGNASRSSWVAAGIGLVVFALLNLFRGDPLTLLGAALALAGLSAATWAYASDRWRGPVVVRLESFSELETDKSFLTRQVLIAKGAALFRANPLAGVGAGRFDQEWADFDLPPALRYQPQAFYNRRTPHNAYVKLLAEAGLVGFLPLVVLLTWVLWGSLSAALSPGAHAVSWISAVFASLCATSIHLWTASALTGSAPWFLFGLGAAAALSRAPGQAFKLYRLQSSRLSAAAPRLRSAP